jgi:hypothetical protein
MLVLVGIYGVIVWPLTFWDMANLGLERYASWSDTVLWSVFAGGSLAGYWCFSGAAFKDRANKDRSNNDRLKRKVKAAAHTSHPHR